MFRYGLSYRDIIDSLSQDALRKKLQTLEARSNGLTVVEDKGAKGKASLEAAVREYLEEVKLNRAHKTHLAYKRALGISPKRVSRAGTC